LIAAPSSTSTSGQSTAPQTTGISPTLPKVIQNPNGNIPTTVPAGQTKIQVGFVFALNYPFVVQNPLSSAQIFKYLPQGIADGLGLNVDQVTLQSLAPLDTTEQMGFITTIALAYVPTSYVNTLSLDLHIPTSAIYRNDDSSVQTLVNYINPAIPITPGSNLDGSGSTPGAGGASPSPSGGTNNDGAFNTDNQNQSSSVKGTTAGIAMAAIGGSAAYGAAMFLIARRYKKRKQSHRRSSSLMGGGPEMRSGSPALMGGANAFMSGGRLSPGGTITHDRDSRGSGRTGNSARTQQISAPMMAENSLGWN
jgi:hypothetical protein